MDKILQTIRVLAENGDENANAVFRDIDGMNQSELADYVYTHDAQLRKLLGVKYLVEKEGNPEFTKEYFDLLNQGRAMNNRDKYTKNDVYNQKLKDVPYYMEKFGLPKENGEYSLEDQIKFANSVSNLDSEELANLAWLEGFEGDADQMRNEIKRTGERLVGDIARKGLNPETGSGFYWKYPLMGARALALPRVHEALESGQDWSAKDVAGDVVEGGLNFVPGMSAASKGVRFLSKFKPLKNLPGNALARVASGAIETAAAPLGSQWYDMAAYDSDDPRGQWDTYRVGGQFVGGLAGLGTIKGIGAQGKNLLESTSGKNAVVDAGKSLMNIADNIGNDAKENIARRQLVMERKAELANDPQYNSEKFLTAKQNKNSYFANKDADLAEVEDFNIRKAEAEHYAATQDARKLVDNADPTTRIRNIQDYDINEDGTVIIRKADGTTEQLEIDPDMLFESDADMGKAIKKAYLEKHPESAPVFAAEDKLSDYGKYPYVYQRDNGQFVSAENVQIPVPPNYTYMLKYDEVPVGNWDPVGATRPNEPPSQSRDKIIRREIATDPDFDAVASGRAEKQPFYNTTAYAGFNAAAREGIVGEGLDLDDRRESALWNNQLKQLRPLVQIDGSSSEYKRQMVDAIMNVMTYGEDLPEDMYKQNRNAYDAIAQRLGISYNNSFKEVADFPTTSYSSAR